MSCSLFFYQQTVIFFYQKTVIFFYQKTNTVESQSDKAQKAQQAIMDVFLK